MTEEKYNGWTNYETWLLKLNLDNDEGTYNMMHDFVREWRTNNSIEDPQELADAIKDYLEEIFYVEEHQIYKICDVWTTRDWNEINWYEIAEAYIADTKDE